MKYPMLTHNGVSYFVYPRKDAKGLLYYRFTCGSESHHKSTKTTARKEAIQRSIEAINAVLDRQAVVATLQTAGDLNTATIVASYLEGRRTVLALSTASTVKHFFKWFLEAFGTFKLNEITTPLFHAFLNELHAEKKPAVSYWRDILTRYSQFFNWCILTDKIEKNPVRGYPRPKTTSLNVYEETVEDSEFSLLCAHLMPQDEQALRCFRFMGIYPMDYAFCEKQDFFMLDGVLTFDKRRGKNHLRFNQPLDGRIEQAIKQIWASKRRPTERMFLDIQKGQEYRTWYHLLERRLFKLWTHLGFPKHKKIGAFRHTFFTEAIERGVPEDVLLTWAGHSKGSTVLRRLYLHRKSTARYRYVETSSPPGLFSLQFDGNAS